MVRILGLAPRNSWVYASQVCHSLQIRKWCQAPDSHREAVRFEGTRYAHFQSTWPISLAAPTVGLEPTRADLGNPPPLHRRGYGAPSRIRTNIVGLEGRLPVPRPGRTGAGAGSRTRWRRRWQRYLAPCAPACFGSCRRTCTCYLRLIRSVLICMSFAAVDWSEWLDCAGHPWPAPCGPASLSKVAPGNLVEPAIACARGTRSSPD